MSGSGLLSYCTSHKFERVGVDLNQPDRGNKSISRTAIASLEKTGRVVILVNNAVVFLTSLCIR